MKPVPSLSPQTAAIYGQLLEHGPLTANEVASRMGTLPHAVYRSVKVLEELKCVYTEQGRPLRFVAKEPQNAVELYALMHREWFLRAFSPHVVNTNGNNHDQSPMHMEFIGSRSEMFEKAIEDYKVTKSAINVIVSGHEVPADLMLEQKRAIERGVKVRMLVQVRDESNEHILQNWKRMGTEVRQTQLIRARIIIYDGHIVYFMSYDPKNMQQSIGIRFDYEPIGKVMSALFMRYWNIAKQV